LQELTEISPKTLQKHLRELKDNKLVIEEGRKKWSLGKGLSYYLTGKGKNKYLKQAISNMGENINNFHRILPILEKEYLLLYREYKRKLYPTTMVGGENGIEITLAQDDHFKKQRLDETFEKNNKALGTFKKAFLAF
jgi:hypothetical protein